MLYQRPGRVHRGRPRGGRRHRRGQRHDRGKDHQAPVQPVATPLGWERPAHSVPAAGPLGSSGNTGEPPPRIPALD